MSARGDWQLLPQLYTSPLLPALIGLLAKLINDHLLAGRIISILSNTLAVGLAMLLIRRLFPQRPTLAWLTGLGLALNHVWCRTAPFVLTDNLFFLLLLGLLLLMVLLLEQVTWTRALAFGIVWGLLFFSREIGLYCGAFAFLVLLAGHYLEMETTPAERMGSMAGNCRNSAGSGVNFIILGGMVLSFFRNLFFRGRPSLLYQLYSKI